MAGGRCCTSTGYAGRALIRLRDPRRIVWCVFLLQRRWYSVAVQRRVRQKGVRAEHSQRTAAGKAALPLPAVRLPAVRPQTAGPPAGRALRGGPPRWSALALAAGPSAGWTVPSPAGRLHSAVVQSVVGSVSLGPPTTQKVRQRLHLVPQAGDFASHVSDGQLALATTDSMGYT